MLDWLRQLFRGAGDDAGKGKKRRRRKSRAAHATRDKRKAKHSGAGKGGRRNAGAERRSRGKRRAPPQKTAPGRGAPRRKAPTAATLPAALASVAATRLPPPPQPPPPPSKPKAPAPPPTVPAAPPPLKGIAAYGFFAAPMGLGESARRGVDALRRAGAPVSTHTVHLNDIPLSLPYPADDPNAPAYDTALIHLNPGRWLRTTSDKVGKVRKIAVWHWELPVFPPTWMGDFARIDELWAPSRFIAEILRPVTNKPIRLVPHPAVAVPVDRALARERLGLPQDRRIILSAFDFGSYPARKNPDAVLRAFRDAFPSSRDGPLLLVKYHRAKEGHAGHIQRIRDLPNVVVIDRSVPQEDMHDIYAASDALVSLHRAEGVGLNILDMMALGKVCIATGYSGNLDFMTAENSRLIPWTMRALQAGDYPYGDGQWWAEPDHDAAVEALRFVARASDSELAAIGARAAADTARDFSFERVSAMAMAAWNGTPEPAGAVP